MKGGNINSGGSGGEGPPGPQGPTGPQGEPGPAGVDGEFLYNIDGGTSAEPSVTIFAIDGGTE